MMGDSLAIGGHRSAAKSCCQRKAGQIGQRAKMRRIAVKYRKKIRLGGGVPAQFREDLRPSE